ncbi:MAG TPA: DNA-processing protein DprA, partial [Chitinophagaceae bacterium]|nr:DNA-processing protein DprA [Chitinophagaceae bacterium]
FNASPRHLKEMRGISQLQVDAILHFHEHKIIENELRILEDQDIELVYFDDDDYPARLKLCHDSPAVLFFKGHRKALSQRMVAIIGTRSHSHYGQRMVEELLESLKEYQPCIVSGLAFGIDILAHKNALKHELPTIGVLASGLDMVYPNEHHRIAMEMQRQGGLLTEYNWGTIPDKGNFPTRNRIVAGMADATIVIETGQRGGSMITAELALSYNREVFCFPGRVGDRRSEGCLQLIKQLKAQLVTSGQDIADSLGWSQKPVKAARQALLFTTLNEQEQRIVDELQQQSPLELDELLSKTDMTMSQLSGALLNLEMQDIVCVLPGKRVVLK